MRRYLIWTIVIWLISNLFVVGYGLQWFPLGLVSFAVLVLIILAGAFKHPREFFWLFLALLPLENIIIPPEQIPFALRPFQLVGGILLIVLLSSALWRNKKNKFKLLRPSLPSLALFRMEKIPTKDNQVYLNPIDRLVLLLGVASLIGAQFAPNVGNSLKLSLVLFSFLGLYWLARNFTRTPKQLLENIWFFFVGIDAVLFFGLYQFIASKFGWLSFQVMDKRINSTFTEPDWLGMYLVFTLALILGFKYALKLLRKDSSCLGKKIERLTELRIANWSGLKIFQFLLNILVFFVVTELVLTVSRSAWLGVIVILLIYVIIVFLKEGWKNSLQTILFAGIKIGIILTLLNIFGLSDFHLGNRVASSTSGLQKITISCQKNINKQNINAGDKIASIQELSNYGCHHINLEDIEFEKQNGGIIKEVYRPDPSIIIRKDIYKKSWREIKKNWLFGQGLGSSGIFLGKDSLGHNLNSSNIFLEVLISMGIAGLAIFILILMTPFVVGLKMLQLTSKKYSNLSQANQQISKPREIVGVFFLLTFFAILIPNLFNTGFLIAFFWAWLAMVMSYLSIS